MNIYCSHWQHGHVILRLLHPARVRVDFSRLAEARSILLFATIAVEQAAHPLFQHI